MTSIYKYDENYIFTEVQEVDPFGPVPRGLLTPPPELEDGQVAKAVGDTWVILESYPTVPLITQFDLDKARYEKRAAVKDELLAWMAADNMSRVRNGIWTVQDLTALLADPAVAAANQFMSTLSFELAAQAISQASTPLLTPTIKAKWISRLQSHFYLVP